MEQWPKWVYDKPSGQTPTQSSYSNSNDHGCCSSACIVTWNRYLSTGKTET